VGKCLEAAGSADGWVITWKLGRSGDLRVIGWMPWGRVMGLVSSRSGDRRVIAWKPLGQVIGE
jgi:hypothetical protein